VAAIAPILRRPADTFIEDLSSGNPDWTPVTRTTDGPPHAEAQFPVRRQHAQATILPTGEVFVSGGASEEDAVQP